MRYNYLMNKIDIGGLKISAITKKEFLQEVLKRIKSNQKTFVITPYSEFLYRAFHNPKILEFLNAADFSLADGIGIFWAKKYLEIPITAKSYWGKIWQAAWQIKYSLAAILFYPKWIKTALPEKIVGADLVWDLAKMAEQNNFSVFLLGGFGDTPELVKQKLISKYPNIKISGTSIKNPSDESVVVDVNRTNTDVLLVAYGPIKQEQWIYENLKNLNVKLAIGVGGSFDYIAGIKSTPPKLIRYSGLEWLWRLVTQPKRIKRIFQATFGLINCLWHYKVFLTMPYRPNAVVIILNKENRVLACRRNPEDANIDLISNRETLGSHNYWQFPQGGIDEGEGVGHAAEREAFEETGLKNLQLIKISDKHHTYSWNNALRYFIKNKAHRNIGQKQSIVYFKFLGDENEVKVDNHEFVAYKWVAKEDLLETIHPERIGVTNIVVGDLNSGLENKA